MKASGAFELGCFTGTAFSSCFPAHHRITGWCHADRAKFTLMASTACEHHLLLNYNLLVMVLKKVVTRAREENRANHAISKLP